VDLRLPSENEAGRKSQNTWRALATSYLEAAVTTHCGPSERAGAHIMIAALSRDAVLLFQLQHHPYGRKLRAGPRLVPMNSCVNRTKVTKWEAHVFTRRL
jgi:hypothetical protein